MIDLPKPAPDAVRAALNARQQTVIEWGERCFGADHMQDKIVRAARFFEEAAELVQSIGLPRDHALRAFYHVYSRCAGDPAQEAGGVANTLMALCGALDLSFDECQQAEIARCLAKDPKHFAERNEAKLREVDALSAPIPSPDGAADDAWAGKMYRAFLNHVDKNEVSELVEGFMRSIVDGCLINEKEHRAAVARQLEQTISGLFARVLVAEVVADLILALRVPATIESDIKLIDTALSKSDHPASVSQAFYRIAAAIRSLASGSTP